MLAKSVWAEMKQAEQITTLEVRYASRPVAYILNVSWGLGVVGRLQHAGQCTEVKGGDANVAV